MKRALLSIITVFTLALVPAGLAAGTAYAACAPGDSSKGKVIDGLGETGSSCSSSGVNDFVATIVRILSIVIGIVAIIMIMAAGFKYITSGGEASKVSNAKNTLIYALIGIIIAVLAQVIVRVVVNEADTAVSCPTGQHRNADGKCVK